MDKGQCVFCAAGCGKADAIIVTMSITNPVVLPKIAEERMKRMETRTARIGVIGLGYVGLPLSLLLSEAGFKVTGFDIDARKVADLEAGRSYIFRIPATEIQSAGEKGCTATNNFSGLYAQDAILQWVATPMYDLCTPDMCLCAKTAKDVGAWMTESQPGVSD